MINLLACIGGRMVYHFLPSKVRGFRQYSWADQARLLSLEVRPGNVRLSHTRCWPPLLQTEDSNYCPCHGAASVTSGGPASNHLELQCEESIDITECLLSPGVVVRATPGHRFSPLCGCSSPDPLLECRSVLSCLCDLVLWSVYTGPVSSGGPTCLG
ncbi:unnamed protein product [Timema podura]|uniref:Uncharacterized protein n=1 Tax=Timema podura TaxID=61482 RepID=A0ABN7NJ64_TIMPD|nr:unnamed protein product [Timema podura]